MSQVKYEVKVWFTDISAQYNSANRYSGSEIERGHFLSLGHLL